MRPARERDQLARGRTLRRDNVGGPYIVALGRARRQALASRERCRAAARCRAPVHSLVQQMACSSGAGPGTRPPLLAPKLTGRGTVNTKSVEVAKQRNPPFQHAPGSMAATVKVTKGVLPGLFVVGSGPSTPKAETVKDVPPLTSTFVLAETAAPAASAVSPTAATASPARERMRGKPIESAFDERSVSFEGYFRESVPESSREVRTTVGGDMACAVGASSTGCCRVQAACADVGSRSRIGSTIATTSARRLRFRCRHGGNGTCSSSSSWATARSTSLTQRCAVRRMRRQ